MRWLRRWLRTWLRGPHESGFPEPPIAGGGIGRSANSFNINITTAQNGYVVSYNRYDEKAGREHNHVRITDTLEGVTEAIGTLVVLHTLEK